MSSLLKKYILLLLVGVVILSWHIQYMRLVFLYVEPWQHIREHRRQKLSYVARLPEQ